MSLKRSSSAPASPHKRFRSSSTSESLIDESSKIRLLKVYIVHAKIDDDTAIELYNLLESQRRLGLEQCTNVADADIIITNTRMRRRLERHVDWMVAKQKAIVTPEWLQESMKQGHLLPCGHYAALSELHDETVENCPDDRPNTSATSPQLQRASPTIYKTPIVKPTTPRVFKNWSSRYACARASPLVCLNQKLAIELGVLSRSRELEGLSINALAYERAVAIIKSYPYFITQENFSRDIVKIPGVGEKILFKIEEFLDNGYIEESRTTRESGRFQSLYAFATIYGIGPSTARKLYDLGMRTIEDLERYYDVPPGADMASLEAQFVTPNGVKIAPNKLPDMSIKVSLALREELDKPIPRDEVEQLHQVIMAELDKIQPGCHSTIVGGYRRGKPQSNDVDIVISHSDLRSGANLVKGLCTKFTQHLYNLGLVTHVMHLSGFHAHNALRTEHWDSLEKALTVFILPPEYGLERTHRRLDLIFAAPESYWTAVVGWSGSRMFERDLRLWAKTKKGMKFDSSGLTRRHDSRLFSPKTEEEVFDILGLDWIDPTMRNANV